MDFIFNAARGKTGYFADLPGDSDAIVLVLLEADGLADDDTLMDCATLADVLDNATESSLTRISLTSGITPTIDYDADWLNVDIDDDPTWAAASGDPIGALLVCYDSDTTGGGDGSILPLTKHDFVVEPNGTDLVAQISASGFYRSN